MVIGLLIGLIVSLAGLILSVYYLDKYKNNLIVIPIIVSVIVMVYCGLFLLVGNSSIIYKSIKRVEADEIGYFKRETVVYVGDKRYIFDKLVDYNNIYYSTVFYEVRYYNLYKGYMKDELIYGDTNVVNISNQYQTIKRR